MGIVEEVRTGRPISVPVIDAHTHLFEISTGGGHQAFHSAEDTVALMDRVGIDAIVTSPSVMSLGDCELANRQAAWAVANFPGRIYAMLTVTPHNGTDGVKREIARYSSSEGFVAIKMLIGYHGAPTRPEYAPAFSFALECGCPVLLHCWEHDITCEQVSRILDQYPGVTLILAHLGGGVRHMTLQMADLMRQYSRVYMDSCGSLWNRLGMDEVVRLIGDDRLCYGSDMIMHDPRSEIGRIVFSDMPEESMRKVLAENYLQILSTSQYGRIRLA